MAARKNKCVYSDTDAFLLCCWKQHFAKVQHDLHLCSWRNLGFLSPGRSGQAVEVTGRLYGGFWGCVWTLGGRALGWICNVCHGTPWRGVCAHLCGCKFIRVLVRSVYVSAWRESYSHVGHMFVFSELVNLHPLPHPPLDDGGSTWMEPEGDSPRISLGVSDRVRTQTQVSVVTSNAP